MPFRQIVISLRRQVGPACGEESGKDRSRSSQEVADQPVVDMDLAPSLEAVTPVGK